VAVLSPIAAGPTLGVAPVGPGATPLPGGMTGCCAGEEHAVVKSKSATQARCSIERASLNLSQIMELQPCSPERCSRGRCASLNLKAPEDRPPAQPVTSPYHRRAGSQKPTGLTFQTSKRLFA